MDGTVATVGVGVLAAIVAVWAVLWNLARASAEKLFDEYNGPEMSVRRNMAEMLLKRYPNATIDDLIKEFERFEPSVSSGAGYRPLDDYMALWVVARFFERMIVSYRWHWFTQRILADLLGFHFLWWYETHLDRLFKGKTWPIASRFREFRNTLEAVDWNFEKNKAIVESEKRERQDLNRSGFAGGSNF